MTELEQRLTNEFGKLAEQYAEDQRRLAGQGRALWKSRCSNWSRSRTPI